MEKKDWNDFKKVKDAYKELRRKERAKIIAYLNEQKDDEGVPIFTKTNGAKLDNRGGMGIKKYGKGKFKLEYDLTNWKYVEAMYNGINFLISLQCFDYDAGSGNVHVLYDRIGIYVYDEKQWKVSVKYRKNIYSINDCLFRMVVTDYDLPLSESDLEGLKKQIINLCEEKITQAKS